MSQTIKRTMVVGGVLAVLLMGFNLSHRAGDRSALARFKAELRVKGEKLTFKELAIAPSTNADELAALKILKGFSTNSSSLGSSIFPRTMEYVAPEKARVAWRGDLHVDNGPSPTAEWEALDVQNAKVSSSLEQIRYALRIAPPDTGWIYDDNFERVLMGPARDFVRDRVIAQALQRDAVGKLHQGDLNGALEDVHALIGQVRMNRHELTLVSQLIRVAIAGVSLGTTWETLQSPDLNEVRLASLQQDWERAEFMPGLERSFDASRANCQVIMAEVRRSGIDPFRNQIKRGPSARLTPASLEARFKEMMTEDLPWVFYRVNGSANEDELTQMSFSTRALDLVRSLNAGRPWPEVSIGLTNLVTELDRKMAADHLHRLRISGFALPNYSRAVETAIHTETQRRLTITAIAIKRYELKHGEPPPVLDSLVPEFLASVPADPMSRNSLCYRRTNTGAFSLYSAGDDGVDNGGKAGMGLWSGADAVWPAAATLADERAITMSLSSQ